jgi:hypothetical protein
MCRVMRPISSGRNISADWILEYQRTELNSNQLVTSSSAESSALGRRLALANRPCMAGLVTLKVYLHMNVSACIDSGEEKGRRGE